MRTTQDVYAALFCENPEDAVLFRRWLNEWSLFCRLCGEEAEEQENPFPEQDNQRLAQASGTYDGNIQTGQIRILSKRYVSNPDIIPYIAILETWAPGIWLAMPFSPFSTPATPLEMETGMPLFGQEVLQAWNGRTIPEHLLENSFLAGELDEKVLADASALFRHALSGKKLPEGFARRRGPVIMRKADPRREYLAKSIEQFRPLSMAIRNEMALENMKRAIMAHFRTRQQTVKPFRASPVFEEDMALAAAGAREAVSADCAVAGFDGKVHVRYNPADRGLAVRVFGTDGEYSDALDGWGVFGVDADLLGVIGGSAFRHQFAEGFNGVLALANPDGDVYPLSSDTQGK